MSDHVNSIDKIVFSYLSAVCKEDFTYNGVEIIAKPLYVSTSIFRGYECPEKCGSCCPRFSLVYLPSEPRPFSNLVLHHIEINNRQIALYHDPQTEHNDLFCKHINKETRRCNIYSRRPFSCDFELIRTFVQKEKCKLTQQLFTRKWKFSGIKNRKGALCTMTPPTNYSIDEVVRKLKRLKEWSDHFGVVTWLDSIIPWVASGPHTKPLTLITSEQVIRSIKI